MGRLLKRIQPTKEKRKKTSFILSERILEKLETLQEELGYQNKSKFVEVLLEFALEELERELNKEKKKKNKEEKLDSILGTKMEIIDAPDIQP